MRTSLRDLYLTQEGRMTRAEFWTLGIGMSLLLMLASAIGSFTFVPLFVAAEIALAYVNYIITSKRIQDIAKPGQVSLIMLQIIIGTLMALACADSLADYFMEDRACIATFQSMGEITMETVGNLANTPCMQGTLKPPLLKSFDGLILLVFLAQIIICSFVPGYRGTNDFGPDPAKK